MEGPEVKRKSEKFTQNWGILPDIFFEFPTGRKLVFRVAVFGVWVAVREPPVSGPSGPVECGPRRQPWESRSD
jgi:hypothetical protein